MWEEARLTNHQAGCGCAAAKSASAEPEDDGQLRLHPLLRRVASFQTTPPHRFLSAPALKP
jgi:hypothetical protein